MQKQDIDACVGVWKVYGVKNSGISNITDDVTWVNLFVNLPRAKAELLCELQKKFREDLYTILKDI